MDELCADRAAVGRQQRGSQLQLRGAVPRDGLGAVDVAESLRDIEATLGANSSKLYGMGMRHAVRRSTLADANETRNWRIWSDLAALLIRRARRLYASEPTGVELDNTVYCLDSTTIDLCLSLFDWAPFRATKAAVKVHTLLDLRGSIPAFVHISDGRVHDIHVLDMLQFEPGAFYVVDRGY